MHWDKDHGNIDLTRSIRTSSKSLKMKHLCWRRTLGRNGIYRDLQPRMGKMRDSHVANSFTSKTTTVHEVAEVPYLAQPPYLIFHNHCGHMVTYWKIYAYRSSSLRISKISFCPPFTHPNNVKGMETAKSMRKSSCLLHRFVLIGGRKSQIVSQGFSRCNSSTNFS